MLWLDNTARMPIAAAVNGSARWLNCNGRKNSIRATPKSRRNIGGTYQTLRLWKDAERAVLRALAIDPQNASAASGLLITRLNATGDADSARRALDGFPEDIKCIDRLLPRRRAAGGT